MTSNEIRAGSTVVMTHKERQAFMKTSPLGQLFGVAHLLPEVKEATSINHVKANTVKLDDFLSVQEVSTCSRKGHGKWSRSSKFVSSWMDMYSNLRQSTTVVIKFET